jgi:hypothetical protein
MAGDLSGGGRSGGRFSHRPCPFQPDNKMKPKFRVARWEHSTPREEIEASKPPFLPGRNFNYQRQSFLARRCCATTKQIILRREPGQPPREAYPVQICTQSAASRESTTTRRVTRIPTLPRLPKRAFANIRLCMVRGVQERASPSQLQHPFYFSRQLSTNKKFESQSLIICCPHTLIVSVTIGRSNIRSFSSRDRSVQPDFIDQSSRFIPSTAPCLVAPSCSVTDPVTASFFELDFPIQNPYHQPSPFCSSKNLWNESIPRGLTSITFPRTSI